MKKGKYTIEKISDNEIKIDNSITCCYAYLTSEKKLLFDVISCHPYIQKIALKFAIKNINPLY